MKLLSLRGVSHSYGEQAVLRDVDLDVNEGELLGIVGPSGPRRARDLSGADQKGFSMPGAVWGRPPSLLWDPPTRGVVGRPRHEILHLLERLNRDGLSIVLSTHDLNGMAAHLPSLLCL